MTRRDSIVRKQLALDALTDIERRVLTRLLVDGASVADVAQEEKVYAWAIDLIVGLARFKLALAGEGLRTPDQDFGPFFAPRIEYRSNEELDRLPPIVPLSSGD